MPDLGSMLAAGLTNNYTAPNAQVALPAIPGITGISDQLGYANLDRDQLNALIQYRNATLAAQQAQAAEQARLAREQMGQQGSQFEKQLFFNEQAQRASELQALRSLEAQKDQAERARQTSQMLGNFGAATQAIQAANDEALKRQGLSLQGYGAAEQARLAQQGQAAGAYGQAGALAGAQQGQAAGAYGGAAGASLGLQNLAAGAYGQAEQLRQGQQSQALGIANLIASLRGPSNAFKQMEVQGYLNNQGAAPLLAALAGTAAVPAYRAPGGTPEAATLATMARDAGAGPGGYSGGGFADAAGIQGLLALANRASTGESADVAGLRGLGAAQASGLTPDVLALRALGASQAPGTSAAQAGLMRVAGQNAPIVPESSPGHPLDTFANLMTIARMNQEAGQQVLGAGYGPEATFGSQVIKDYQEALGQTNETYMGADDPRLVNIYRLRSGNRITEAQARQLTHYAEDYYRTYGVAVAPNMLNEMLGQVLNGGVPDLNTWSEGARKQIPGYGTPAFKPPPKVWTGGTPAPGQAGAMTGQQVLDAIAARQKAGQPIDMAWSMALWKQAGLSDTQAAAMHQYGANYFARTGRMLSAEEIDAGLATFRGGGTPVLPPPGTPIPPPPGGQPPPPGQAPTPPPPAGGYSPPVGIGGPPNPGAIPGDTGPSTGGQHPGSAPSAPTFTRKGWSSPEGYPAVTIAQTGQAGYLLPNGQIIDGAGKLLVSGAKEAVAIQQSGQPVAQAAPAQVAAPANPVSPAQPQYTAPPAAPQATTPAPAAPKPTVTYRFDYLPGGKGLGYLGTDGAMFDATWAKIG